MCKTVIRNQLERLCKPDLWVCVMLTKSMYCTTLFCFTRHTCKQKQDSVVSVVSNLDPLDRQMAVVVLRGHHG